MKLIVMDVRRTKVAEQADIHLQPRGGTDGAVAWGMMRVLIKEGLVNKPFIDKWCIGYDELVAYAEKFTPEYVEKESGVPAELVVKAARMFADGPSGMTISGQSIMHQHNGCNNARACSLLMALTGNVENAGGGMLPNWPEDYLRWDGGYTPLRHRARQAVLKFSPQIPPQRDRNRALLNKQAGLFRGYDKAA